MYCQLAADVGAPGVKVRPNGLPDSVPEQTTLEQIGNSLARMRGIRQKPWRPDTS